MAFETEKITQCILCGSDQVNQVCDVALIDVCLNCGLYFDSTRPTLKEISKYYSKMDKYENWIDNIDARDKLWRRRLAIVKKFIQKGKLLDIGAGIGQFLKFANKDFDVYGSEVSKSAIKIAKEKFAVTLEHGTVDEINWGQKFDVITMFHVLEHVPYPGEIIQKCHKLLNKSGIFIIAVPNDIDSLRAKRTIRYYQSSGMKEYPKLGLNKINLSDPSGEVHLSHFKQNMLCKHIEETGFKILSSSLDPYYVYTQKKQFKHYLFYIGSLLLKKFSGVNIYDTMLIVAKKE